jgi:uncharacterized protein YdeI (YjbR/CyaY-like superfamily)
LGWILQKSFSETEHHVAGIGGWGALLRLDRWDSETNRRDQLSNSLHAEATREHLERDQYQARQLTKEKRMRPAGLKAFAARIENKSGIYSYEQRRAELEKPYCSRLKGNRSAWDFFQAQPPSYRKMASWYIMSAKTEETRCKRFEKLMTASAKGKRL